MNGAMYLFTDKQWPEFVRLEDKRGDYQTYFPGCGKCGEIKTLVRDILSEIRCRRSCADCPHERDEGCEFMDRAIELGVFDEPA